MIDYLFEFLINKVLGSSLILLVILTVRPLVLKYLNASASYRLWLMIPFFILLPTEIFTSSNGGAVLTIFSGIHPLSSENIVAEYLSGDHIRMWIIGIWLFGFVSCLGLYAKRFTQLFQSLKVSNFRVPEVFNKASKKVKINTSALVDSPAIFGLFSAYLILPKNFPSLSLVNQSMILKHELFHISRRDHQINILRAFIKSVFWFNPIVYFADKYCEADQEISCDLGVLKDQSNQQKKNYANALIESVSGSDLKRNRLISQWTYRSLIKERVKMLKNTNVKKWHSWIVGVFAIGVVVGTSGIVMADKTAKLSDPVSFEMPKYPRQAAEKGIEGWVKVGFDIDKNGRTYNLSVIKSLPKELFDRDAIVAVEQWMFEKNNAHKGRIYTLDFKLDEAHKN